MEESHSGKCLIQKIWNIYTGFYKLPILEFWLYWLI